MGSTFLFDANSLYARSWFAARSMLSDPEGIPSSAEVLRLAINTTVLLLNPETNKVGAYADKCLFAWDGSRKQSKDREEKPPEFHDTKALLKDTLSFVLGATHAESPTEEGDDVVATAVSKVSPDDTAYVISGDKDLMQLYGKNCRYYSLHDKCLVTESFITAKFGGISKPDQVSVYLALVGDSVDNIKGVRGIGPVKCKKLFKSVTARMSLLETVDAIAAQLNEEQQAQFYESLDRTLLKDNLPDIPAPAPLSLQHPDEVDGLDIPQIGYYYRKFYEVYRCVGSLPEEQRQRYLGNADA